jgi:hypothetical protein
VTFRLPYFVLFLLLLVVEVLIARFVHDGFVRPYLGDFLVVILIYCFLRSFLNWTMTAVAAVTLLFAFLVEFAQYFAIVDLLDLQHNRLARIIMGTTFSWHDLLAYTLGTATAYLIDRR